MARKSAGYIFVVVLLLAALSTWREGRNPASDQVDDFAENSEPQVLVGERASALPSAGHARDSGNNREDSVANLSNRTGAVAAGQANHDSAEPPATGTSIPHAKDVQERTSAARGGRLADPAYRAGKVETLRQQSREAKERALAWAFRTGAPARIEEDGRTMILIDYNRQLGPVYRSTLNINAAISTAADLVRVAPYGLSGSGITAGIWDGGNVRQSHQEFRAGQVTNFDLSPFDDHATHVAGTMMAIGTNAAAPGMASNASLLAYDFDGDLPEMTSRAMATPGEAEKIQISNHSYGIPAGWVGTTWNGTWTNGVRESDRFGMYYAYDAEYDALLFEAPYYLPFFAAGNERDDLPPPSGVTFSYYGGSASYDPAIHPFADGWKEGGHDTIPLGGTAKNIMLVGAVNDAVTAGARDPARATPAGFTSWGPTDDGRIKPDVVANGVTLYSSGASSDTSYLTYSGTSMATPNASGSALLLLEHYANLFPGRYMRSATIKGLIIHTADDLYNTGPDFRNGWGLMNTRAAADHLQAHAASTSASYLVESVLHTTNSIMEYPVVWDRTNALKATLVWTDPPGPDNLFGLNLANLALVNDLDLRIIAPDGGTNFPWVLDPANPTNPATTGDNFRDNVEQVVIEAPPTTGVYTVRVTHKAPLAGDLQHYSLLLSGSVAPLRIDHQPLPNQLASLSNYVVEASITPASVVNPEEIRLRWGVAGAGTTNTVMFTPVSSDVYRANIPAHATGTEIAYYIEALSYGTIITDPAGAPFSSHAFVVAEGVALVVTGMPQQTGSVLPEYGATTWASGRLVQASAPYVAEEEGGQRYRHDGWTGDGSLPASGATNAFSFVIEQDSLLTWMWKKQYAFDQVSSPTGLLEVTSWWDENTLAETVAADPLRLDGSNVMRFVEWQMGGLRQSNSVTGVALNPVSGVLIEGPAGATAFYLPDDLDSDGNGLPDWWQRFYFGDTGRLPGDDADADGFTNGQEFLDETSPVDESDAPSPPRIDHIPLADPQTTPAPWTVAASVTDNAALASVVLEWNRNEAGWESATMQAVGSSNLFLGIIPAPIHPGDRFSYRLIAEDNAGFRTTNGTPHSFDVVYPRLEIEPSGFDPVVLTPPASATVSLALTNTGNGNAVWSAEIRERFEDGMENGAEDWTSSGFNNTWHLSTNRAWSGSSAWYSGQTNLPFYRPSTLAVVELPALTIEKAPARLTMRHWIDAELYTVNEAWDGGYVALSTNHGASYEQLVPEGGYPYLLKGWTQSPFPDGTPVYAGTGGWSEAVFDLSAYTGQAARIAFVFGSDSEIEREGWYIDEVAVEGIQTDTVWASLASSGGSIPPGSSINLDLQLASADLPSGVDRFARVAFSSNDPEQPLQVVPLAVQVRTPPVITGLTAEQTSTNGEGLVTLEGSFYDPDGEALEIGVEYSIDQGVTWLTNWIVETTAATGSVNLLNNGALAQITWDTYPKAATNGLEIVWSTTRPPVINIATGTLVRVMAWDGLFSSGTFTSDAFLVDNEGPAPPADLASLSHTRLQWSANTTFSLTWAPADDGHGIGAQRYRVRMMAGDMDIESETTNLAFAISDLADGADWSYEVTAIDRFGNTGVAATDSGPYWIDATPPDAGNAVITIPTSPFGNYTFSAALTSHWSGFADNLSGIGDYFVSFTNNSGAIAGEPTTNTTLVLSVEDYDRDYTVFVWSRDVAGNIGSAISTSIMVLSYTGRLEGAVMNNGEKEVAGLDASDPSSQFVVLASSGVADGDPLVLRWSSASNRFYTIVYKTNLLESFTPVTSGLLATPPVNVFTTEQQNGLSPAYYRIGVTLEP